MDFTTGAERVYRSPVKGTPVRSPALSPDGSRAVFQVQNKGTWLLDLNKGTMRKVMADPSAEAYTWSPDGRPSHIQPERREVGRVGDGESLIPNPLSLIPITHPAPNPDRLPALMMRRQLPGCVLGLGVFLAACAREAPAPVMDRRPDIELKRETVTVEARVPRSATLDGLLRQGQLSTDMVQAAMMRLVACSIRADLRTDRPYRLVRTIDGLLREFEYQIDADRFLRIISHKREQPDLLVAEVLPYDKQVAVAAVRGRIDDDHSSVIAAMQETGETIQLAMAIAEMFSGEIDFDSDLQPGDSFESWSKRRGMTASSPATEQSSGRGSSPMAAIFTRCAGRIPPPARRRSTTRTADR